MFWLVGVRSALLLVFAAIGALLLTPGAHAQEPQWTSPHPLVQSASRVLAFIRAAEDRLSYVPGEVLIKFKNGVDVVGQQRALDATRNRPAVSSLKWSGDIAWLRDDRELDAKALAERLAAQPEVEYAEPNYLYRRTAVPNDPSFAALQWNFSAIDLPKAWDINPGATSSIVAAVVDYGITTENRAYAFPTWDGQSIRVVSMPFATNPDLSATRLIKGKDFAFWAGPVLDMQGHGTHVSSTIGQDTNNNLAGAGVAYNAGIMPIKVCLGYWEVQILLSAFGISGFAPLDVGGCDIFAVAEGIRYAADNGAKVINISLGGPGPSITVRDALAYAVSKGAVVVIAAGNEFEDGNPTSYPAAYGPALDGVITVASVNRSLQRAYYSNTGSYIEISAPGGDVRQGFAGGIWQATILPTDFDIETVIFPRFDRYAEVPQQGTSMAAPHVAGIAALIMSQGVTSPAAVEALIRRTARDLGQAGRDDEYGYGLVQPRAALFGFGVAR